MSYIADKLEQFFLHQKADTTDNVLWKFGRVQRIINSVACYKKSSKKVSEKCIIVTKGLKGLN